MAEEKWNPLKTIVYVKQQNPPWESRLQDTQIGMWRVHLKPLFDRRNQLYLKYLSTKRTGSISEMCAERPSE